MANLIVRHVDDEITKRRPHRIRVRQRCAPMPGHPTDCSTRGRAFERTATTTADRPNPRRDNGTRHAAADTSNQASDNTTNAATKTPLILNRLAR